jgi:thioredoxin 1
MQEYTHDDITDILKSNDGVMLYFSGENCGVCHVLQPKIKMLFDEKFSKIHQVYISADKHQEIAASFNIFTVPSVMVFFENQEFIRESRHISIVELQTKVERPYGLFFK